MSAAGDRPAKSFSCIRCFERKVKCDKQSPCSNCVKSKAECVFRVPPAPRRRKKRPQEEVLVARLKKCEDLLRSKGIDVDTLENSIQSSGPDGPPSTSKFTPETPFTPSHDELFGPPAGEKPGQLIVDHGKSRFIENNLWTSVSGEVSDFPPIPCLCQ